MDPAMAQSIGLLFLRRVHKGREIQRHLKWKLGIKYYRRLAAQNRIVLVCLRRGIIDDMSPKARFRDIHTIDSISRVRGVEPNNVACWVSWLDNKCKIL